MKRLTKNIKKRRFGQMIERIGDVAQDINAVDKIVQHKLQQHLFRSSPKLPKQVIEYETQMLDDAIAPHVRRLQSRYKPIKQRFSSVIQPFAGLSAAPMVYEKTKQSTVKKGLVNPVLHEIRRANPSPTRTSIKYAPSTYQQSIDGMSGTGYNRNSNKLRQLQEDATTLATGGRPNPEHNNKRFYGLFGITATNEPQKAMTMIQRAQRNINQSLRTGHSNRRVTKSAIQKGSYSNSFVSGSAVDPNMIVQPKKGRRFKGQTTGMTLVSKRAKTIRKESNTTSQNAFGFTDEQKQLGDQIAGNVLGLSTVALGLLARRRHQRAKAVARNALRPSGAPSLRLPKSVSPSHIKFQNQMRIRNRLGLKPGEAVPAEYRPQWRNNAPTSSGTSSFLKPGYGRVSTRTKTTATPKIMNRAAAMASKNKGKLGLLGLASVIGTVGDVGTIAGDVVGGARDMYNRTIENKVNTQAKPDANYKKPIMVHDERFDNRDVKWKNVNSKSYLGDEVLASEFGTPNVYGFGDSDAYQATSFEQLPTRLKNEYAMYGRPVEQRVTNDSALASEDSFRNRFLAADTSGLVGALLGPVFMGNKLYADYGDPVASGRTPYRTGLKNAVGNNPVSTITGYGIESSREGQKSLSAKGAIEAYKNNFVNEMNYMQSEFENLQNQYASDPSIQTRKKIMEKELQLQRVVDAYNTLDKIGGKVDSLKSLQTEIDNARKNNNQAVVNLLTSPINFSYMGDGEEGEFPALYDLAGYQNPLRRVTVSRVGDKYGQNLMPYQLRSGEPQSVSYIPGSELSDNPLVGLGDAGVAMMTGITPSGMVPVKNTDNDWMIGGALSRYAGNEQPVYVNEERKGSGSSSAPIDPAKNQQVAERNWLPLWANRIGLGGMFGKKQQSPKKSKTKVSRTVKKNSLTQSAPMLPMNSSSPIKMPKTSSSQSGDMFVKSLNPKPKPIESVHPKHKNKYFK